MTLHEIKEASDFLRSNVASFERCWHSGNKLRARTYIPNIAQACELLGIEMSKLLGTEYDDIFAVSKDDFGKVKNDLMMKCPHCDFTTDKGVQSMRAHIGMKHKPNNKQ